MKKKKSTSHCIRFNLQEDNIGRKKKNNLIASIALRVSVSYHTYMSAIPLATFISNRETFVNRFNDSFSWASPFLRLGVSNSKLFSVETTHIGFAGIPLISFWSKWARPLTHTFFSFSFIRYIWHFCSHVSIPRSCWSALECSYRRTEVSEALAK